MRKNTTINVGSQQKPCLLSSEGNIGFCEGRKYQAGSGSKVILIYYRVFHFKNIWKKCLYPDYATFCFRNSYKHNLTLPQWGQKSNVSVLHHFSNGIPCRAHSHISKCIQEKSFLHIYMLKAKEIIGHVFKSRIKRHAGCNMKRDLFFQYFSCNHRKKMGSKHYFAHGNKAAFSKPILRTFFRDFFKDICQSQRSMKRQIYMT